MSEITAKITSKGQITLPREIRDVLGVHDGDRVRFTLQDGQVVLYPQRDTPSFRGMIGLSPLPAGQDACQVTDDLRHDEGEREILRAAPAHPHITVLDE